MRKILLFITVITSNFLVAQELPKFIQDRLDFCDSNLSDVQANQLRTELDDLENYFVTKGLLTDKSGTSYKAVYEQIVKDDDLNFSIDITFELLEELDFQVLTDCLYKLLTLEQLTQLTFRHHEAAERISSNYSGNLSPRLVAQRIVDNLSTEDFELEFYQISSLLIFYRISYPAPEIMTGLPNFDQSSESPSLLTIKVYLNEESQIIINNSKRTIKQAENFIYDFLKSEPSKKGIEISASRNASYASYSELLSVVDSVYTNIREQSGSDIPKNIIFKEPE